MVLRMVKPPPNGSFSSPNGSMRQQRLEAVWQHACSFADAGTLEKGYTPVRGYTDAPGSPTLCGQ